MHSKYAYVCLCQIYAISGDGKYHLNSNRALGILFSTRFPNDIGCLIDSAAASFVRSFQSMRSLCAVILGPNPQEYSSGISTPLQQILYGDSKGQVVDEVKQLLKRRYSTS